MRVLIACHPLKSLNGVFFYVYELARELQRLEHYVCVTSPSFSPQAIEKLREKEIPSIPISSLQMGEPDIIHLNQPKQTICVLNKYPGVPVVATIHSTVYDADGPIIDKRILRVISIRQDIEDYYNNLFKNVIISRVVIPNGIDLERFKPDPSKMREEDRFFLWVGGNGRLRREALCDFAQRAKKNNAYIQVIGCKQCSCIPSVKGVKCSPFACDVEKYTQACLETGGIFLGRTTIEGWVCGKPGWIYDVDKRGNVLSCKRHLPPENISDYNIKNVVQSLLKQYGEAINARS